MNMEPMRVCDYANVAEMQAAHRARRAKFAAAVPPPPPEPEASPPFDKGSGAQPAIVNHGQSPRVTAHALDPAMRLDNFAVYDGNRIAHAAMLQAAHGLARSAFNPIFVYAGVGLGKTHLLQGTVAMAQAAGALALYLSAEAFLYNAEKSHATLSCRLLAIDDVQFIAGKHQHAALRRAVGEALSSGRQLVLAAADRPAELAFDPALGSRIDAGLTAPIGAPDGDARAAILRSLVTTMAEHGHQAFTAAVTNDIIAAIAAVGPATGRCLGGVLNRLHADHLLRGLAPTVERALQAAAALRPQETRMPRIEEIQTAVARHYNTPRAELLSARRTAAVVKPRQVAMYLAKIMTLRSLPEIGRRFGGRDHTTVLHAVRKMEGLVKSNQVLADEIAAIKAEIAGGQQQ